MARKIVNRLELREENDAAERMELEVDEELDEDSSDTKTAKKPAVKRKSRAKAVKEVRLKAFWGVFNQSLRRISRFEYSQRKEADTKAAELTESQKTPHFVQLVKEAIEE